ncbi:hypothetical protein Bhyg_04073 [Pseudolycoriella hygida]|uniref:Ras-associating domain-containing protein n=1 Tax=Pseudolycoriella hygida TaxID=35572 RepID=A0A9Q0NG11_9DIPT|nr:hypothetical protein Bhyg_04073 [Pseudolycoriella hygida]
MYIPQQHVTIYKPNKQDIQISLMSLLFLLQQTTIKVFTSCLRLDIEYKTLGIQWDTTSKEVVAQLLRRCKMRQRDPRLFYLSMEVTVRRASVRTVLMLDDEARPAILQACHPKGDSKFYLQLKPGGLIRVHTSVLQPTSQYKSLVISEETTSDELLTLLLSSYNSSEPVEQFSLYEVCPGQEYQRKLHPDDLPLRAQIQRTQKGEKCHFLVRKNPNYPRRKQILPPIIEQSSSTHSLNTTASQCPSTSCKICPQNGQTYNTSSSQSNRLIKEEICKMCKNNFKSCEFCNKNVASKLSTRSSTGGGGMQYTPISRNSLSYNPVYNIREIRTVCNSFSSLGIDKKLLEVERPGGDILLSNNKSNVVREAVNNNPAKGFGNFIYI